MEGIEEVFVCCKDGTGGREDGEADKGALQVTDLECFRRADSKESSEFNWFRDVDGRHREDGRIAIYFVEVRCENDPAFKHDVVNYLPDAGFKTVVWSTSAIPFSAEVGSRNCDRIDEHSICYRKSFLTAASNYVAVLDRGPVDDTNVCHVHGIAVPACVQVVRRPYSLTA